MKSKKAVKEDTHKKEEDYRKTSNAFNASSTKKDFNTAWKTIITLFFVTLGY